MRHAAPRIGNNTEKGTEDIVCVCKCRTIGLCLISGDIIHRHHDTANQLLRIVCLILDFDIRAGKAATSRYCALLAVC